MAITLNKKTVPDIVANAYGSGLIRAESSSTVAVYQISRYWRELFQTAPGTVPKSYRNGTRKKWQQPKL